MVDMLSLPGFVGGWGTDEDPAGLPSFYVQRNSSQKIRAYGLHVHTYWYMDADQQNGKVLLVPEFDVVSIWFKPYNGYNGTVHFEASPDGGLTWFSIQGVSSNAIDTLVSSVSTPTESEYFIIYMPAWSHFRARLSNATQGSLTVAAKLANFNFSNAV